MASNLVEILKRDLVVFGSLFDPCCVVSLRDIAFSHSDLVKYRPIIVDILCIIDASRAMLIFF